MQDEVYIELVVRDGGFSSSPVFLTMEGRWPDWYALADAMRTVARVSKSVAEEREARA